MGVTGYGPDQSLLRLERDYERLEPDAVVLVLCTHNDLGDLVRNKLFRFTESGELTRSAVTLGESVHEDFADKRERDERIALVRAIQEVRARRTRWREFNAASAATPPPYIAWYLEGGERELADYQSSDVVHSLFFDYYDAQAATAPQSSVARRQAQLLSGVLSETRAFCERMELPLYAVVVPTAVDLCAEFDVSVDRAAYPSYRPQNLCDLYAQALSAAAVRHTNLYDLFATGDPCARFVGHTDFPLDGSSSSRGGAGGRAGADRRGLVLRVIETFTERPEKVNSQTGNERRTRRGLALTNEPPRANRLTPSVLCLKVRSGSLPAPYRIGDKHARTRTTSRLEGRRRHARAD